MSVASTLMTPLPPATPLRPTVLSLRKLLLVMVAVVLAVFDVLSDRPPAPVCRCDP